jgi:predicted heme/steroid binding protein
VTAIAPAGASLPRARVGGRSRRRQARRESAKKWDGGAWHPIYVSVQGLYPDGSVSAEWDDAVRLGQGGYEAELADNLNESIDIEVAGPIAVPPPPVVAPAPAPAAAALEPAGWGLAALAFGIPIAVLLAAALRRRRMAASRLVDR